MSEAEATETTATPQQPTPGQAPITPTPIPVMQQDQTTHPETNTHSTPQWKFTESLPSLTEENIVQWRTCLDDILIEHELEEIVAPTFQIPNEATEERRTLLRKALASCRRLITNSLPQDINRMLPPSIYAETPNNIIQALAELLQAHSATDHSILEPEARQATLDPETSIKSYIMCHRAIRARMLAACYPGIGDERTTVRFIVQGLRGSPQFSPLIPTFKAAGLPHSVTKIHNRLSDIEEEHHHTPYVETPTPRPNRGIRKQQYYSQPSEAQRNWRPYYRRRNHGRWHQPPWLPTNQPQSPWMPNQQQMRNMMQMWQMNQPMDNQQEPLSHNTPNRSRRQETPRGKRIAQARAANANCDSINIPEMMENIAIEEHGHDDDNPEDNSESKFALDSGTHTSHINFFPTDTKRTQTPIVTETATSRTTSQHTGTAQVKTDTNHTIKLPAIINKHFSQPLLSVHSIAKQYGLVIFSEKSAIIVNTKHARAPTLVGAAPFQKGLYILNNNKRKKHALAARTLQSTTSKTKQNHTTSSSRHIAKQRAKHHTPRPPPKTKTIEKAPKAKTQRQAHTTRLSTIQTDFKPNTNAKQLAFQAYHLIFNHIHPKTIQAMAKKQVLPLPDILKQNPPALSCSGCAHGKARPKPHHPTKHHYDVSSSMSSDICGPISPPSTHGNIYFMFFIETNSRYLIAYFLPNRKGILQHIKQTIQQISKTHGKPFDLFTSDNAKEYLSTAAQQLYQQHGITVNPTTPYTPQENSIAERLNLTIFQAARAALHHAKLPLIYWEDAVRDAVFKYNISLHRTTRQLPYTTFHGHAPPLESIFAFGQIGSVPFTSLHPKRKGHKLHARSFPARYMYAEDFNHVIVLNLNTHQYTRVRTANFKPYQPLHDPVKHHATAFKARSTHPIPKTITTTTPAPTSHKQATRYPDSALWKEAHNEELDKLDKQNVIKWIPKSELPRGAKLIPLTMSYRYKRDPTGQITERKARCSIRGDRMSPGVHYDPNQTASYNADKTTVRLTFALAAYKRMHIEQFDIKSAYTHESFKYHKPVLIKQFPRFDGNIKYHDHIGRLLKNLYGNPSGGFYYLDGATEFLISLGYCQSEQDPCMFYQFFKDGTLIIITLTTDDFLVAASNKQLVDRLFAQLQKKDNIKRMGTPKQYIGWKVQLTRNGAIHISQPHYIQAVLDHIRMANANPRDTPYIDGMKTHGPDADDTPYPEIQPTYRAILGTSPTEHAQTYSF